MDKELTSLDEVLERMKKRAEIQRQSKINTQASVQTETNKQPTKWTKTGLLTLASPTLGGASLLGKTLLGQDYTLDPLEIALLTRAAGAGAMALSRGGFFTPQPGALNWILDPGLAAIRTAPSILQRTVPPTVEALKNLASGTWNLAGRGAEALGRGWQSLTTPKEVLDQSISDTNILKELARRTGQRIPVDMRKQVLEGARYSAAPLSALLGTVIPPALAGGIIGASALPLAYYGTKATSAMLSEREALRQAQEMAQKEQAVRAMSLMNLLNRWQNPPNILDELPKY